MIVHSSGAPPVSILAVDGVGHLAHAYFDRISRFVELRTLFAIRMHYATTDLEALGRLTRDQILLFGNIHFPSLFAKRNIDFFFIYSCQGSRARKRLGPGGPRRFVAAFRLAEGQGEPGWRLPRKPDVGRHCLEHPLETHRQL